MPLPPYLPQSKQHRKRGHAAHQFCSIADNFKNIDLSTFVSVPNLTFLTAFSGFGELSGPTSQPLPWHMCPLHSLFCRTHCRPQKPSTIIERELLEDPGLSAPSSATAWAPWPALSSAVAPNTTHGESVGCVAITKNASVVSILGAAILAIIISFFTPLCSSPLLYSSCVMGGVRSALRIYSRIGS